MEGVPTRAPTVVPKDGLGGRGIPRSGSPIRGRRRAPRARLAESPRGLCRLAAVVGVQYEGSPLAIPTPFALEPTSQAMEIHQCLLGPFDGCNAGPDQSKRNATTADARCALRTKRRAGAHTDRARLKRLLPEGASSSFVPPGPASVRPTSSWIPRSTEDQHTDDIRPHRSTAPAATSTRPALELERE